MRTWEDEQFVKVYVRSSPSFLALHWHARALFRLLMTELNRSGILELGKAGIKGVAVAVRAPWSEIEKPLQELLDDGCVVLGPDAEYIAFPNFVEAQEAKQSDKARQQKRRDRIKAATNTASNTTSSQGVTLASRGIFDNDRSDDKSHREPDVIDRSESQGVTPQSRDVTPASRIVTRRHAEKRRDLKTDPSDLVTADAAPNTEHEKDSQKLVLSSPNPKPKRERKPKQQELPPSVPASVGWEIWRNLYQRSRRKYGRYVDSPEDGPGMVRIVDRAIGLSVDELRRQGVPGAPIEPVVRKLLTYWFIEYLRDSGGDKEWIAEQRHPLRYVLKGITKYGTPWSKAEGSSGLPSEVRLAREALLASTQVPE